MRVKGRKKKVKQCLKTYRRRLTTELAEATFKGRDDRAGTEFSPEGSAPVGDGTSAIENRVGGADGEAAGWWPMDVNNQPGCIKLVLDRCPVSGHLAREDIHSSKWIAFGTSNGKQRHRKSGRLTLVVMVVVKERKKSASENDPMHFRYTCQQDEPSFLAIGTLIDRKSELHRHDPGSKEWRREHSSTWEGGFGLRKHMLFKYHLFQHP